MNITPSENMGVSRRSASKCVSQPPCQQTAPRDQVQEEVLGPLSSVSARLACRGEDPAETARADPGRQGQETAMSAGPLGPMGNRKRCVSKTGMFWGFSF